MTTRVLAIATAILSGTSGIAGPCLAAPGSGAVAASPVPLAPAAASASVASVARGGATRSVQPERLQVRGAVAAAGQAGPVAPSASATPASVGHPTPGVNGPGHPGGLPAPASSRSPGPAASASPGAGHARQRSGERRAPLPGHLGPQAHRSPPPRTAPETDHHPHPPTPRRHLRQREQETLSPWEVVDLFCTLDAEGARLASSAGLHPDIDKLTAWSNEPGWDETTVIRSFSVGDADSFGNFAHVEVRFSVIGTLTPDHLEPMPPDQTVEFHLERKGRVWTIESPLYEPHVFRSELLHRLARSGTTSPPVLKALADAH